ncbi:MAG: DNA polymerase III subunit chi [Rhodoferax sp.]|nr:DNA polymerase III subunit chi [Rhodoferax sp.]
MTKVEFHSQVPDRLQDACRLLRKAAASSARVQVTADENTLTQLDQFLWSFSGTDFVPHCFQDAPLQVLENTAIVLTPNPQAHTAQWTLVNLGPEVPVGFEQFTRIIEIVSKDLNDKQDARRRWKHYAGSGCELSNLELQPTAPR